MQTHESESRAIRFLAKGIVFTISPSGKIDRKSTYLQHAKDRKSTHLARRKAGT